MVDRINMQQHFFGHIGTSCKHTPDILSYCEVDIAKVLANSRLFTHPGDMEQRQPLAL